MKTLTLNQKRLFYYYLTYPDITSFDENANEKFRAINEKLNELNGHEIMLYQWQNKVGAAGTATNSLYAYETFPRSIKEFNLEDIEGLIFVNTRPARGAGFLTLNVKLKGGRETDLLLFFMNDNSSDVARWDNKVKIFEVEVLPDILSFMNTRLIKKVESYNC